MVFDIVNMCDVLNEEVGGDGMPIAKEREVEEEDVVMKISF